MRISSYLSIFLILTGTCLIGKAQINFTANDKVPEYNALFTFGTNLGYTPGWKDEEKASLAAGNLDEGVKGAGASGLRLSLPEHFLEKWGYNIRVNTNNYYANLGLFNHTAFIEGPSDEHKDGGIYGGGSGSKMFANMYEPIWDNGANETPVNDNNYLALYIYKTAMTYGDYIKFWEIWNEPDYTNTSFGWKDESYDDNWWIRDPKPEELTNLQAPVQHYIRALRICYEVIKYVDENDFVCTGGIGYSSFLDAILRNTDNPDNGSVSNNYPLKGGAYFDCVSYHNYPMFRLKDQRHSDRAKEILIESKVTFENLLADYGYNGTTFPKKEYIITETNLPHTPFGDYIGSYEAQRNYNVKAIIACQKAGIRSLHTFALNDGKKIGQMTNSFHAMGLYQSVEGVAPYNQEINPSGIACRSAMHFLKGKQYSKTQTTKMQLPDHIDGAAFINEKDQYSYVLWAKTTIDNSESASANYNFPAELSVGKMYKYNWDYRENEGTSLLNSGSVELNSSPVFIYYDGEATNMNNLKLSEIKVYPNPAKSHIKVIGSNYSILDLYLISFDGKTTLLHKIDSENWEIPQKIKSGMYILKIKTFKEEIHQKLLIEK